LWWAQGIAIYWVVLNGCGSRAGPRILLGTLALLGFAAVVLAAYQIFVQPDWLILGRQQAEQFIGRASGPFGIPNSLAALLLLLLPPMAALALRPGGGAVQRTLCAYLAGVYLFGLVLTASRGAWIALVLTLFAWPLLIGRRPWRSRLGRLAMVGLVLVGVNVAVFLAFPTLRIRFEAMVQEAGERTRPIMWRGAWEIFRENPLWGSGAGSYNMAFEKHRPAHFQMDSQWTHNDYLNTLSDYGAVGFGLFFGACVWVIMRCWRHPCSRSPPATVWRDPGDDPRLWQGIAMGLLAFSLQLAVDFHLKIPALVMVISVLAALLTKHAWSPRALPGTPVKAGCRVLYAATAVVMAWGILGVVVPHYRGEALRYPARQAIDKLAVREFAEYREVLEPARADLVKAVVIDPSNPQTWADLAYVISLWAHVEPQHTQLLGREAEDQSNQALILTRFVPEFWLRHAVALDMQGRWLEAGASCVEALKLAPNHALVWYYQAYHLSLNPVTRSQARSALAISLRLDPGNSAAQLLRQQLAEREN
jgi:O-antigen ligase